jgi:hypothetical protein
MVALFTGGGIMSNGDQTGLVTNQQPIGQPAQTTQPAQQPMNMYQLFGSMSPQKMLEYKSEFAKWEQTNEIVRNVGDERAGELLSEYPNTKMALDRSKLEVTTTMKKLDSLRYSTNTTPQEFLKLMTREGGQWTRNERTLWKAHYDAVSSIENKRLVAEGKMEEEDAADDVFKRKAHGDFIRVQNDIFRGIKSYYKLDFKGDPETDEEGKPLFQNKITKDADTGEDVDTGEPRIPREHYEHLNNSWDYIQKTIKDEMNGVPVDNKELMRNLSVVANLIDVETLKKSKILVFGDTQYPLYGEKQYGDATLKKMFFDHLVDRYMKARDHLASVKRTTIQEEPADESGQTGKINWSQFKTSEE